MFYISSFTDIYLSLFRLGAGKVLKKDLQCKFLNFLTNLREKKKDKKLIINTWVQKKVEHKWLTVCTAFPKQSLALSDPGFGNFFVD